MTDKERLEKARKLVSDYTEYHKSNSVILTDYGIELIEWLIKRVQELEEEVEKQKNRKYLKMRQRDDFMKKAQHYKQALEEILNADCNLEGLDAERELDRVTDIALKALEVTEK